MLLTVYEEGRWTSPCAGLRERSGLEKLGSGLVRRTVRQAGFSEYAVHVVRVRLIENNTIMQGRVSSEACHLKE